MAGEIGISAAGLEHQGLTGEEPELQHYPAHDVTLAGDEGEGHRDAEVLPGPGATIQ